MDSLERSHVLDAYKPVRRYDKGCGLKLMARAVVRITSQNDEKCQNVL